MDSDRCDHFRSPPDTSSLTNNPTQASFHLRRVGLCQPSSTPAEASAATFARAVLSRSTSTVRPTNEASPLMLRDNCVTAQERSRTRSRLSITAVFEFLARHPPRTLGTIPRTQSGPSAGRRSRCDGSSSCACRASRRAAAASGRPRCAARECAGRASCRRLNAVALLPYKQHATLSAFCCYFSSRTGGSEVRFSDAGRRGYRPSRR